ncbi:polysaccharide pyruvyl transferase family protein [Treponema pedis]|uniref:polysaccharide pyruvyl transferase family protein n=1 Tax=Treponema pedis TaxID=409322 RepID=UPI000428DCFE|nr:polysaccharide pyruvyl transferase family protein [Treponema pedis]
MKKIGVLTFWNVPNYGTFLQAYALQKSITYMKSEDNVVQIAYLDKMHYRKYYKINNTKYTFGVFDPRMYINILLRLINHKKISELKAFLSYYKQYIPCSEPLTKISLEKAGFDYIVLGSDIIWDYSIPFFNNDQYLFGNNLNCKHIISYAASFGTVRDANPCPDYVVKGLNALSFISVRDENSKKLVKKYTKRNSQIVCDPTILWDFMNDINIPAINEKKYIIVYGSDFRPELIQGCIEYAKVNGLQIICLDSLDDNFDWCDKNIKQNNLTPFKWLAYFKYADTIFTCTYHGLLFSLIFNKKIVFSPTQFILDKSLSLIDFIDLKDVLINYETFEEKADWKWDYEKINARLAELRCISLNYLQEALS